jgi:hypothetical protein
MLDKTTCLGGSIVYERMTCLFRCSLCRIGGFVREPSTIGATDHELKRTVAIIETLQFGMSFFSSTWLMAQQKLRSIAQDWSVTPTAKHLGMILLQRMAEFQL